MFKAQTNIRVYYPNRILSASNAVDLSNWIRDCIEAKATALLIDMKYVSFMDSSGLGALVGAQKMAEAQNVKLGLCSLGGQARMLLEMTNVESLFAIYADQEDFEKALTTEPEN